MLKLSTALLLAILCAAQTAYGFESRKLKTYPSYGGETAGATSEISGESSGDSFTSGGSIAESSKGHSDAKVEAVALSKTAVKNAVFDLVAYFLEAHEFEEVCHPSQGQECCAPIAEFFGAKFKLKGEAFVEVFAAVLAKVEASENGKACAGGEAAAYGYAEAVVKAFTEVFVVHGYDVIDAIWLKESVAAFAAAFAEVYVEVCAENGGTAEAYQYALAKALATPCIDVVLKFLGYDCYGDPVSDGSLKVTPSVKGSLFTSAGGFGSTAGDGFFNGYGGSSGSYGSLYP